MEKNDYVEFDILIKGVDKPEYIHFKNLLRSHLENELQSEKDIEVTEKQTEETIEGGFAIETMLGIIVKKISESVFSKIFNSLKNFLKREGTPTEITIKIGKNLLKLKGVLTKADYKIMSDFLLSHKKSSVS